VTSKPFPLVIVAVDYLSGEMAWHAVVADAGALTVPAVARQLGRPVTILVSAPGGVWEFRPPQESPGWGSVVAFMNERAQL
jgi:hypothetical protein